MENLPLLIVFLFTLILSAFFSGMEIAFISSNRVRATLDVNRGGFINRILNIFYGNGNMVLSTLLVGNNIVLVIYGMAIAILLHPILSSISENEAFILVSDTFISTLIILFVGEFLPKTIFRLNPNTSLRNFSVPLLFFYYLLYPISWFTAALSSGLMKMFGIKVTENQLKGFTMGELDAYLQENIDRKEDENIEVEHEVKIFRNALDFSSTHLRDCMIPRNEIVAVNIDTIERKELAKRFHETGLSKIPVYRNEIDNIIGYIHVSELFHSQRDWKKYIKPVLFAPETMLANKMMRSLLSEKKSMAIVVDEFGGTSGLVTLEDLVEEIFGDIEDEHDKAHFTTRDVAPGIHDFSGRIEISQLNEEYHLDIPESEEYQTLAGYLLTKFEAIPEVSESITINDIKFSILRKSASKIELVRVDTNKAK